MAMAEEKRVVELALQMDESGRPPGCEEHDSPSVSDHLRSFFSLPAKRPYRQLGNDEADGQQPRTTGGLKTMPFIIGTETCERLAVVGVQANMMVYLITKYNMKKVAATSILNVWFGTMGLATLPGAFLADSYVGRFGMISIGCFLYVLGIFILTLTAIIPGLLPSSCSATDKKLNKCESASAGQFVLLVLFFAVMAGGSAGTKPSAMAFGADQFDQGGEREKRRLQSYFNWYYFVSHLAVIISLTVVVYIQSYVSWGLGFSLCTACMLMASIFFRLGAPNYRYEVLQGSALAGFAQVIVASLKKRNLPMPPESLHLHHGEQSGCDKPCLTNQFSATEKKLNKCESASARQFALLVLFFTFMAGGSARTRPSVMIFGANQFAQGGEREKRCLQSYFNWYYFAGRVAIRIALSVVVYIQSDVSWGFGFSLCTASMVMSSIFFLLVAPNYRYEVTQGSPLTGFAQVILVSVKKCNLPLPPEPSNLHHGEQSSCDKPCLTNQFTYMYYSIFITL